MKIATTFFMDSPSDRWMKLFRVWNEHALKFFDPEDICVISDTPEALPNDIESTARPIILSLDEEFAPRPEGQMAVKRRVFNRKGSLLVRARYCNPLIGNHLLYLDLDAWLMRHPGLPLIQASTAGESLPFLAMARDANVKSRTNASGWPAGPWFCGGIIWISSELRPVDLHFQFWKAMGKVQESEPDHYLQEQIAWSCLMNRWLPSGRAVELPGQFNTVPHLGHMRYSNPVVEHNHGDSKWKKLGI